MIHIDLYDHTVSFWGCEKTYLIAWGLRSVCPCCAVFIYEIRPEISTSTHGDVLRSLGGERPGRRGHRAAAMARGEQQGEGAVQVRHRGRRAASRRARPHLPPRALGWIFSNDDFGARYGGSRRVLSNIFIGRIHSNPSNLRYQPLSR